MATKAGRGRPAKLVNPKMQSVNFEGARLQQLKRIAHERSIATSSEITVSDLVREAIEAHYSGAMMQANEAKPMSGGA